MGALDGKVAIVTGGSSGIGERIVELFVEQGAKVVVAARRQQEGSALEKRLGVHFIRTDVAKESDVKAMVDQTIKWFGRVDCLVNNAGVPSPMVSITEIDVPTIDQLWRSTSAASCWESSTPVMLAQKVGSIINIGSIAGLRGGASGHLYSATKAAVQSITRSAARSWAKKASASTPYRRVRSSPAFSPRTQALRLPRPTG
jgi:NAD(P)-dependent dehydrogenase (short-subunit alcohol dehydrogenase family)